MKLRAFIGVIFIVASLLKLATMWNILHIDWLSNIADDPWAAYFPPLLLIFVGASLIYDYVREKDKNR